MSSVITVFKHDGTLQCHSEIKPRPIDSDRQYLDSIEVTVVGAGRHERLPIMIQALCGAPTGWANIFDLDRQRITRTHLLKLSQHGFKVWHFPGSDKAALEAGDDDPFPLSLSIAARFFAQTFPDRLGEVVGYVVRVYKIGDPITDDYLANRLNLETDAEHRILRYWFG